MALLANFLITTGIIITLIIIIGLIRRKKKTLSHYILIAIFSLLFFVSFYSYGEVNDIEIIYTFSFVFADAIGFLIGPLLYLYIKSIYLKKESVLSSALWHFFPAILYIVFISIPIFISTIKDDYLFSYIAFIDRNEFLLQLQVLYLLAYVFLSFLSLKKFQRVIKENFSNLNDKDLKWVTYLLYGIVAVMGVQICIEAYSLIYNGRWSFDNTTTTIAMIIVVVYLGYFGTGQSRILLPSYLTENETLLSPNKENNHHLANASATEIAHLESRLLEVLKEEKPYVNELLNLEMLAEMIPTTDRKLSALLNHKMNITFYDLINSYRVEGPLK